MKKLFCILSLFLTLTLSARDASSSIPKTSSSPLASFGTPSKSGMTLQDRSVLPTRISPHPIVVRPRSTFGTPSKKSKFAPSNSLRMFRMPSVTSIENRNSLPTRSTNVQFTAKPKVAEMSASDLAMAERAKQSGAEDVANNFRTKYSTIHTSQYTTKPIVWPIHIPHTYSYNGTNVNIVYNSTFGGYGYYYGGNWRMYDALQDAVMLDVLMNRHDYYVQSQYQTPVSIDNTLSQPISTGGVIVIIAIILGLIVVVAIISKNLS